MVETDKLEEGPTTNLLVYTSAQLAAANKVQREQYGWDFCTRFNFLLVAYSLFATAAAGAPKTELRVAVLLAGAFLCALVWLTILRVHVKMKIAQTICYRLSDHAIHMVNNEAVAKGRAALYPANALIAYWASGFCVASLLVGGVASLFGWP